MFNFKLLNKLCMSIKKLNILITALEDHIKHHEISNPEISKVNIAWHLDHSFKVINNVIKTLQDSDPKQYKNDFKLIGMFFFKLGYFPRGKGKAPRSVRPPEVILKVEISNQLKLAKSNIETIPKLDKNAYFKHPLFGNINKAKIYRFLILHTHHHLKIIKAIMAKQKTLSVS